MRRIACGIVLAAVLLVPAGQAQDVVSRSHATLETVADLSTVVAATVPGCSGGSITSDATRFVFEEGGVAQVPDRPPGHAATSCMVARLPIAPPDGSTSMTVDFVATRTIDDLSMGLVELAIEQEIGWYAPTGDTGRFVFVDSVFLPGDGTLPATPRSSPFGYLIPGGQVAWRFNDPGEYLQPDQTNPVSGQAFTAEVSQVVLRFDVPEFDAFNVTAVRAWQDVPRGLNVTTHELDVTIPPSFLLGGGNLSLELLPGHFLSAASEPNGTSLLDAIETFDGGVRIPGEVMARFGAGVYHLSFDEYQPTVLPRPVPEPTRLPMLYLVALVATPLASAGAGWSVARYQRSAKGRYRRAALTLWITLAVAILYWLFQALYTWIVITPRGMDTLPLQPLAVTFYVQMALLAAGVAIFAILVGGRLQRNMVEEAQRQEEHARTLAKSNADLERFAYVASHDLQEPLRKVASYTQLLQRRYQDKLDDSANDFIGYAVDGALRMQQMVQALLAFSRADKGEFEPTSVDLGQIMGLVQEDLSGAIEASGATIDVGDMPTVDGESPLLRQMLQNLVANAIKFQPPGQAPHVAVRCRPEPGCWHLEVEDNGIGIEMEQADEVFEVFRRLHHRSDYEGTGIGLSLVRRIAERHGGKAWFTSVLGEGTTFHVTLGRT